MLHLHALRTFKSRRDELPPGFDTFTCFDRHAHKLLYRLLPREGPGDSLAAPQSPRTLLRPVPNSSHVRAHPQLASPAHVPKPPALRETGSVGGDAAASGVKVIF